MLDKSKRFRKTQGGFNRVKGEEFDFPKATSEQLKEIKERMQKDQKRIHRRRIFAFLTIILAGYVLYLFIRK